jgi:hypothetical protein
MNPTNLAGAQTKAVERARCVEQLCTQFERAWQEKPGDSLSILAVHIEFREKPLLARRQARAARRRAARASSLQNPGTLEASWLSA